MTITTNDVRDEYTASGGQTVFNYTFKIFADGQLNVYITPAGQEPNDSSDITTAYTIDPSSIGDEDGGFLTLDSGTTNGDRVTIVSDIPEARTTDYQNSGDFLPDTVNADIDTVVSLVKQVEDKSNRTLAFQNSLQNATALTLPAPSAGLYMVWNGTETGLENTGVPSVVVPGDLSGTLTQLKASTTVQIGDFVVTTGYNSNGDGGDNTYEIVAAATGTDDGGSFIDLAGSGLQAKGLFPKGIRNVKQWGAVGDGVTDDSGAIALAQAALSQSGGSVGELLFPFANGEIYAIASTLVMDTTRECWRGLGNPDKRTGAGAEANCILWTGAAAGRMLTITNPLDNNISNIGFNGNDVADQGVFQEQTGGGGQGGCTFNNVVVEKCNKNLWTLSGLVDGGRNIWQDCTMRKTNGDLGVEQDNACVLYLDSSNVIDQWLNCEVIHASSGTAEVNSVAFYCAAGSPDIYIKGSFLKAETALIQGGVTGGAYFNCDDLYVEGLNFFRSTAQQVNQKVDFTGVRHVGTGGNSIEMAGLSNGQPLNLSDCDFRGDIVITGRDDFPIIMVGTKYNSLTLDNTAGNYTNLLQLGRTSGSASTSSAMVNVQGVCTAMANVITTASLNTGLQNGSVFRSERTGGAAVTVKNPTAVEALDEGRVIELWMTNTGGSPLVVTWESAYKGASLPTGVAANSTTIMQFRYNGTSWFEISRVEGIV